MTTVQGTNFFNPWRVAGWGLAAALLATPAIAGWPWEFRGFVLVGVVLTVIGVTMELGLRHARDLTHKAGFTIAVATWFFLLWSGFIGAADDYDANLFYLVEIAIALSGAVGAKFRPDGMARAMVFTALFQLAVAAGSYRAGWQFAGEREPLAQLILNSGLIVPWALAGVLFHRTARRSKG